MKLILSGGAKEYTMEIEDFVRDLTNIGSVLNFNLVINENIATTIEQLQSLYISNSQIYSIRIFDLNERMLYNFQLENGRIQRIKDYTTSGTHRKMILTIAFDKTDIGDIYTN